MLKLHNTLAGKIEIFEPQNPPEVTMYNCGPTVYSKQHIGNIRPYVFVDILRRALEAEGYTVTQVINITDVGHLTDDADAGEDKMEKAVKETGIFAHAIAQTYTNYFLADLRFLNIPTNKIRFAKATDHIKEQIELIQTLEQKGHTYKTSDGVYYDTSTFPEYGKLGHIKVNQLKEGARVKINPEKRNPADFALWKFSKPEDKRQQEWSSPWGIGFPGWHVECSAMSMKYLGETLDIHTGGIDHIPIHHNNEIAQSEGATGKPFARFWLHNEFITIAGQKISKSIGNGIFISDIIKKGISPLSYRYWLLTAHYSSSINFSWETLRAAHTAYKNLLEFFILNAPQESENEVFQTAIKQAIEDDLDTPKAISLIWDQKNNISKKDILFADKFLGLDIEHQANQLIDVPNDIITLAEKRKTARDQKDFKTSDKLRAEIESRGYIVRDTNDSFVVIKQ